MRSKRVTSASKQTLASNGLVKSRADRAANLKQLIQHQQPATSVTSGQSGASKKSIYICAGCKKPIKRDKYLLKACDKYWHENCLRCDRCQSRLGELGSTLYFKSDMNLCRQDYLEMFGETGICSVCDRLICASEMVMRAKDNVYHLECFACQLCGQRFCVGDRFYLCENKVVCQFDYEEHILPIQRSMMQRESGLGARQEQADSKHHPETAPIEDPEAPRAVATPIDELKAISKEEMEEEAAAEGAPAAEKVEEHSRD